MHDDCAYCGTARQEALMEAGHHTAARTVERIRSHGYQNIGVMSQNAEEIDFSYTVGLYHRYGHPELVLLGLDPAVGFDILDITVTELVDQGIVLRTGRRYGQVLENLSVVALEVVRDQYDEYFGQAEDFYRSSEFPVLALIWPDQNGNYPWDDRAPSWLRKKQPRIWMDD